MDPVLEPSVAGALAAAGVAADDVAKCAPLTGGTYNTVRRVTLRDGRRWVVKVPPSGSGAPSLSYEHDLLRGESVYYGAAAAVHRAPVPQVVHAGLDGELSEVSHLVMTERPGIPWHMVDAELTAEERGRLRRELGGIVARLNAVTGDGFGYPSGVFGPPAATWREAFTAMTRAVLHDARRYDARLPRPVPDVREILASADGVLDEVTRPALVHFDLWQGNLLLDGAPGARTIGGVVDGERMFWGDPVAELVSLALFDDIEEDEALLAGYAGAGGDVRFTESVRLRLNLYRCYLYLIMLVEVVPRRYSREQRSRAWRHAGHGLTQALIAVQEATGSRL
ncbi:phosphotransferase [Streptomyces longisporoflavus]|uniref:phosphotransferase family protein n=1 Tax=Streptomyces longisporoflavus TaxID=28044 RepID=UPI00167DA3D2|nr:aminoglycoside phosphotransferase family protein [Streptomyces longisporoflavus]GGV28591.1 phosphotransferase [Streptomyces longisporoflavus]